MAKGPDAFRTISEAAAEIGVAQHVLRFWESRLSFLKPMKRTGGRRFYRPADIALLHTVRRLLHDEGYSLSEVQKLHREQGLKSVAIAQSVVSKHDPAPDTGKAGSPTPADLTRSLAALEAAKHRLDRLLGTA
jgi:DNA-binding transcriptional MerR regulator